MLIAAAAETWRVDPASCRVANAIVIHTASQQRLSSGNWPKEPASRLPPSSTAALKHPKAMMIIGKAMKRLDTPAKTTGRAMFGIDVQLTGMLTTVIARPPVFGARVKNVIANQARAVPGVKAVMPIDSGVAVVADGFWPAKQGRDVPEISWDEGPLATLDTLGQRRAVCRASPNSRG